MRNKRIILIYISVFFSGVIRALTAILNVSVLQPAPCNCTGLVSRPTSAPRTVLVNIHRAQCAVQATKGKQCIIPFEIFHFVFLSYNAHYYSTLICPINICNFLNYCFKSIYFLVIYFLVHIYPQKNNLPQSEGCI